MTIPLKAFALGGILLYSCLYNVLGVVFMKIVLASNSPRRKDILSREGVDFKVIKSDFEESSKETDPLKLTVELAYGKAFDVFNRLSEKKDVVVLGADTIVYLNGEVLGKPKDKLDAVKILSRLSGNTHTVVTGYALISENKTVKGYDKTLVTFNDLTKEEIVNYVEKALPLDKAGAYGYQDGYNLVKSIKGSSDNVIGLPIEKIKEELKKF